MAAACVRVTGCRHRTRLMVCFGQFYYGVSVTDDELWSAAAERVRFEYQGLPPQVRQQIAGLAAETAALKEEHQRLVGTADAAMICAGCRGACCNFGRHHFT